MYYFVGNGSVYNFFTDENSSVQEQSTKDISSSAFKRHYKSDLINYWEHLNIEKVTLQSFFKHISSHNQVQTTATLHSWYSKKNEISRLWPIVAYVYVIWSLKRVDKLENIPHLLIFMLRKKCFLTSKTFMVWYHLRQWKMKL